MAVNMVAPLSWMKFFLALSTPYSTLTFVLLNFGLNVKILDYNFHHHNNY